jgi:acylphosphatase
MKRIHAEISGRVQMVSFRDFAKRKAERSGVVGWVRNLPDGHVEILAEGEEHSLEVFILELKRGPILARVDDVAIEWSDTTGEFSNFSVRYD